MIGPSGLLLVSSLHLGSLLVPDYNDSSKWFALGTLHLFLFQLIWGMGQAGQIKTMGNWKARGCEKIPMVGPMEECN